MKILRWIIKLPIILILLSGTPLIWLFAFAFGEEGDANSCVKEFVLELFE